MGSETSEESKELAELIGQVRKGKARHFALLTKGTEVLGLMTWAALWVSVGGPDWAGGPDCRAGLAEGSCRRGRPSSWLRAP